MVRCKVLQFLWHEKEQILSCDFEPVGKGRLATSGGDSNIWHLSAGGDDQGPRLEYLATLSRHEKAVNVVRWAPGGSILASAGDDATILLWREATDGEEVRTGFGEDDEGFDKEVWRMQTILRGTLEDPCSDIYDIAWSPDGRHIVSGSIDYKTRIWDVSEGKCIQVVKDHSHFVQGVAWDPLGEYIATQSSDRSMTVYRCETPAPKKLVFKLFGKLSKMALPKQGADADAVVDVVSTADVDVVQEVGERPSSPTPMLAASAKGKEVIRNGVVPMEIVEPVAASESGDDRSPSELQEPGDAASATAAPSAQPASRAPRLALAYKMFHDDTLKSFFRRLSFSPDGALLIAPAGLHKSVRGKGHPSDSGTREDVGKPEATRNTVYLFARSGLNKGPIAHLPGHKKPPVAVRFNPVPFALREALPQTPEEPSHDFPAKHDDIVGATRALFQLKHRFVFAVATTDTVMVYDTQQQHPIWSAADLHYAAITDVCWSGDGSSLLVSSADGYCSVMHFGDQELGPRLAPQDIESAAADVRQTVTPPESPNLEAIVVEDDAAQSIAFGQKRPSGSAMEVDEGMGPPRGPQAVDVAPSDEIPRAEKKRRIAPTLISS
ncbi:WD40 repeat-like protein [Hyaloraphidium curvatum]|nr:WD40 repeat-like protein [Hyaloraphidium curvatum]